MLQPITFSNIGYQYANYMNTSYMGDMSYNWVDFSSYSIRKTIPLDSDGRFCVGILELTPAGQAAIPEDNIQIINRDYPGADVIVPKQTPFAAPTESHVLYFIGITDEGVLGSTLYYIAVNNEPTATEFPAPLYRKWYNVADAIPYESEFTMTFAEIAVDSKLSNAIRRMIKDTPSYSDTGDLNKHGVMSAFNILVKNIEVSKQLVSQKGYNSDMLDSLGNKHNLLPCWREKKMSTIFSDFTENDKIMVRKSYDFSDNTTTNEYVLGYILDNIYSRIT